MHTPSGIGAAPPGPPHLDQTAPSVAPVAVTRITSPCDSSCLRARPSVRAWVELRAGISGTKSHDYVMPAHQDGADAGRMHKKSDASSATTKTSFSGVSGSWTQPATDCEASCPSDSAFWVGLDGYSGEHLDQTGTSVDPLGVGSIFRTPEPAPVGKIVAGRVDADCAAEGAERRLQGGNLGEDVADGLPQASRIRARQLHTSTATDITWDPASPTALAIPTRLITCGGPRNMASPVLGAGHQVSPEERLLTYRPDVGDDVWPGSRRSRCPESSRPPRPGPRRTAADPVGR